MEEFCLVLVLYKFLMRGDINTIELDLLDISIRTFISERNGLSVFNGKY